MLYQDGWYEIAHLPPEVEGRMIIENTDQCDQWAWAPRRRWLTKSLGPEFERWYMKGPIYTYSEGLGGPDKKIEAVIPLTWCFKQEKDATLFILRWGR